MITWALFGISGLNLGIAAVAVRRREVRGAVAFSLVMICVSLYSLGTGIRAGSTTLSLYQVGTVVKFAGILGLGPTQLRFGLIYTGRESVLTRRYWAPARVAGRHLRAHRDRTGTRPSVDRPRV